MTTREKIEFAAGLLGEIAAEFAQSNCDITATRMAIISAHLANIANFQPEQSALNSMLIDSKLYRRQAVR